MNRRTIAIAGSAVAVALVLAAVLWFGSRPGDNGVDADTAAGADMAPPSAADPGLAAQAAAIEKLLAATPADGALWQSLARTYMLQQKFTEAVPAYKSAIENGAANGANGAAVLSAYGEAQAMQAAGQVTEGALAAFRAALAKDPAESRARYYLGLADAQAGRLHEALDAWIALEAESPENAPWRKSLAARIEQTAAALGLDPLTLPGRVWTAAKPTVAGGEPTVADLAAAARLSPSEREELIGDKTRALAGRLAREPGAAADWKMLGQAYGLLDDRGRSLAAWKQAALRAPDDAGTLLRYAEAMLAAQAAGSRPPPEFADLARRIRVLDPASLQGLFFAGLAEKDAGNADAARTLWEDLLRQLPEDSPLHAEVRRRLDALGGGG
jgi:cytochrome c-type biogenesis protein CcmH